MKNKLLVINKSDLKKTQYVNPKIIGGWLWGRRISNYIVVLMNAKNKTEKIIKLNTSDCLKIQDIIDSAMIEENLKGRLKMKIIITEVHKEDAWYYDRDEIIGKTFINAFLASHQCSYPGYFSVSCDWPNGGNEFFHAVKFKNIKEETFNLTKQQLKDIMNLGMDTRQYQLNGQCDKSGNEILDEWIDENLK